jgi:DNA-binding MarR family transcriptional regulator
MSEDSPAPDAFTLQAQIAAFVRAFGLHQPDQTPCGQPIPVSEAHAIGELDRDGPLTQQELARRLRLEKSTVSRLVGQLITRGWVQRGKCDGDARLVWLELTDAGRKAPASWPPPAWQSVPASWKRSQPTNVRPSSTPWLFSWRHPITNPIATADNTRSSRSRRRSWLVARAAAVMPFDLDATVHISTKDLS